MSDGKFRKKKIRNMIREHARVAKLLLPPVPENCPPYTRQYFESYRSKLFHACKVSHHKKCPATSHQGHEHFYCSCPCHRVDISKHKKRKMWFEMKKELAKKERKRTERTATPRVPRTNGLVVSRVGPRGAAKKFRYLSEPEHVPAGIMATVHGAIKKLHEGTIAEITAEALAGGLDKVTGQDPTSQTSIMLHRLLKAGHVEVV